MKFKLNAFHKYYKNIMLFILVLFVIFYLFSCKPETISQDIETVENLDERTYLLNEWKVYTGDSFNFASPDYDDSHWESIDFPKTNYLFDLEKSNYFWFRKTFYVSEELKGEALGYVAGKLSSSTEIYFNGGLVGISGFLPPPMYYPTPGFPRGYILSDKLVNYGGKNVIAMRVYNELDFGTLSPGFITNNTDRKKHIFLNYAFNIYIPLIFFGLSIMVAVYSLIMFLQNRNDHFHLYLCFACLSIIFTSVRLFAECLPVSYFTIFKVSHTGLLFSQMFYAFYFQSFYNIHSNWKVKLGFFIILLPCSIILVSAETLLAARFLVSKIFYIFIIAPVNIYLLILSIYAIIKGNKYAKLLIIGVICILLTALHDIILVRLDIEPFMWFAHVGFIIYIMFILLTNSTRYTDTKKKAERLNIDLKQQKDAFFRFVPVQFLSLLGIESAVSITRGDSSQMYMSVLFSDIKRFTVLSERKTPEENFNLLNNYILRMEGPINKYNGFVDKYIGDAIMALFSENHVNGAQHSLSTNCSFNRGGIHEQGKTSSDRALLAAIEMIQQVNEFNKEQKSKQKDVLNTGIGINTGSLMLGTIGGTHRLDTTVIGDAVNLASRLENLTRYYKNTIIISEWSYNNLSDPDNVLVREIDNVIVKGKTKSCRIFDVFEADTEEIKELKLKTRDLIQTGIKLYKERKFKQAYAYFKKAKNIYPDDYISHLYMTRCAKFIKNPPPDEWTAEFKMHA